MWMASALVTYIRAVWATAGWWRLFHASHLSHHCGRRLCFFTSQSSFHPFLVSFCLCFSLCIPSCPLIFLITSSRSFLTTQTRSGTRSVWTCTQGSSISGSGALAAGWMLWWTTVCRSVGTGCCSSAAQRLRESSGAPCWRRPTPSEQQSEIMALC